MKDPTLALVSGASTGANITVAMMGSVVAQVVLSIFMVLALVLSEDMFKFDRKPILLSLGLGLIINSSVMMLRLGGLL